MNCFSLILVIWSAIGFIYCVYLGIMGFDLKSKNKDKERVLVLFSGPVVWIFNICLFVILAIKPIFKVIDEWLVKE